MSLLRHSATRRIQVLPGRLLVGRGPRCLLRLTDPHVSSEHATLLWRKDHWEVRDLASRNGTFVDGERLDQGGSRALVEGSRLSFGTPEDPWVLEGAGPPTAVIEDVVTGKLWTPRDGLLALPDQVRANSHARRDDPDQVRANSHARRDPAEPAALVFEDVRGRYVLELGDGQRLLVDGEVIDVAGRAWRVWLPEGLEATSAHRHAPTLDALTLTFGVSPDEEHVDLTLDAPGTHLRLEAREHHYVLLTLARLRMEDRDGVPAEQGWVDRDRLLGMLRIDRNALNVAIYRARGQFAEAGVQGAGGLVEVRRGQRRLGIEPGRIVVRRPQPSS